MVGLIIKKKTNSKSCNLKVTNKNLNDFIVFIFHIQFKQISS